MQHGRDGRLQAAGLFRAIRRSLGAAPRPLAFGSDVAPISTGLRTVASGVSPLTGLG
jgi:hypothetical protein